MKIRKILQYLREKGWKWLYNYIHFCIFYDTKNLFLIKYIQWKQSYPSYLEIECTTKCPIFCKHCEHTYWNEPSTNMSFNQFKHIIDQFPNLRWIGMTGIGEEFINPDFMKMLTYIKTKNPAIFIEIYDSFLFLNEQKIKDLIDLGVERIFVSVDAAIEETYKKVRIGADWNKLIKNIETFINLKQKKRTYFPQLCFHYIITRDNFHEILDFVEWVNSLNTDVKIIQFSRMLHRFDEIKDLFVEIPEETIKKVNERAKELSINITWSLNVPLVKPPINKCTAWTMPFVFVNGDVIPCCAQNEGNRREWQHETSMGNIFNESFRKIWKRRRYKNLREEIKQNKASQVCRDCPLFEVD